MSNKKKRKPFQVTSAELEAWRSSTQFEMAASEDETASWPQLLIGSICNTWTPLKSKPIESYAFYSSPPVPGSPQKSVSSLKDAQENIYVIQDAGGPAIQTQGPSAMQDLIQVSQNSERQDHSPHPIATMTLRFVPAPPTCREIEDSLDALGIKHVIHEAAYFSNKSDIPRPTEYAGKEFRFTHGYPDFSPPCSTDELSSLPKGYEGIKRHLVFDARNKSFRSEIWTLAQRPPTCKQVMESVADNRQEPRRETTNPGSPIPGPTPHAAFAFKPTQISQDDETSASDHLVSVSMELHARTRAKLLPDPKQDPICAAFVCVSGHQHLSANGISPGYHVGMIVVKDAFNIRKSGLNGYATIVVATERALIMTLARQIRDWDPEFLVGYEVHKASWGYLLERASGYKIDFGGLISRIKDSKAQFSKEADQWGYRKQSMINVDGRIVLNVWRLMRKQLSLTIYSLENTVWHTLRQRIPHFAHEHLTSWYDHGMLLRWRTLKYYLVRVQLNLKLLDKTEMVSQTAEFALLYGIDFNSVLTRGSQFRVESVMSRITRPESFIMYSPSRQRVAEMNALECIPLNMEPASDFYTDPVGVFDFQSLYPSIMIAYNYCYSTLLGHVDSIGESVILGALPGYKVPLSVLKSVYGSIIVSPNGSVFVKENIRQGVLGRMLIEILETRFMVKKAMKRHKDNPRLMRILDAKQLGLKLLANVTYGYTSASFSGRMPCSLIADSIVQTGRSALEHSIQIVDQTCKVIYADTDSLFVHMKGYSKDEAFVYAERLVNVITMSNPAPVTLLFEKIYFPCVLLAKKRYVGFKYEQRDSNPEFDAKGIETVRRDGCKAVAKSLENALKILFRTRDLSQVKAYLTSLWQQILKGDYNLVDFIIAKQVKLGTYTNLPPGAVLAMKNMEVDDRDEPEYGERVPYVVVHRGPRSRLIDAVVSPHELIDDSSLRLNGTYYIEKQIIPSLARIFNLIGVDVHVWFQDMPKVFRVNNTVEEVNSKGKTIDTFYTAIHCYACHRQSDLPICKDCMKDIPRVLYVLSRRLNAVEKKHVALHETCAKCTGHMTMFDAEIACTSLDCPIFFSRKSHKQKLRTMSQQIKAMQEVNDTEESTKMYLPEFF